MFLATPGMEVINLRFARDNVVCVSWNIETEEHVPSLRYGEDSSLSLSRPTGRECDLLRY